VQVGKGDAKLPDSPRRDQGGGAEALWRTAERTTSVTEWENGGVKLGETNRIGASSLMNIEGNRQHHTTASRQTKGGKPRDCGEKSRNKAALGGVRLRQNRQCGDGEKLKTTERRNRERKRGNIGVVGSEAKMTKQIKSLITARLLFARRKSKTRTRAKVVVR